MILQNQGLEAFVAIVEAGTVHSAADTLGLTQTAVTQRIKSLESELKLTLFLRSRRGMALTSDGTALLQYCRAAGELEGVFLSKVSGKTRGDVQLTVVGPTSAMSTRVATDCLPLYSKHPQLRLHLRSEDHSNRLELIRKGSADLAIVPAENIPNEMDSKLIKPDRYLLVASASWRGRKLSEILERERVIDFYENDSTTTNYLKYFGLNKQLKRDRLFVNSNQALLQLISAGVGFGTLTDSMARPHIEAGSIIALNKAQAVDEPLALVWYPRTQKPEYFTALLSAIK